jgi:valyl-tRNA synthetase
MPFITEKIYQDYFRKSEKEKSIHISEWPEFDNKKKTSEDFDILMQELAIVRQEKSENKLPLNFPITTFTTPNYSVILPYTEDFKSASGAIVINLGKEHKVILN